MNPRFWIVFLCAIGIALLCLIGACDKNGKSRSCEAKCLKGIVGDIEDCNTKERDCLLDCSDFDDNSCIDDCEPVYDDCMDKPFDELTDCEANCPCTQESEKCMEDCGTDDFECWEDCDDALTDCAERDEECMDDCNDYANRCWRECEDEYEVDWEAWVNCRYECTATVNDCADGCL